MRQLADLSLLLGFRDFAVATYKLAAQVSGGAAGGQAGRWRRRLSGRPPLNPGGRLGATPLMPGAAREQGAHAGTRKWVGTFVGAKAGEWWHAWLPRFPRAAEPPPPVRPAPRPSPGLLGGAPQQVVRRRRGEALRCLTRAARRRGPAARRPPSVRPPTGAAPARAPPRAGPRAEPSATSVLLRRPAHRCAAPPVPPPQEMLGLCALLGPEGAADPVKYFGRAFDHYGRAPGRGARMLATRAMIACAMHQTAVGR
jgi:hypothetical protein